MMRLLAHFGWMCQDLKEEKLAKQSLEEAFSLATDLDTEGVSSPGVSSPHIADVSLIMFFLGWVTYVLGQSAKGISLLKRSEELSQVANYELGLVLSRLALSEVEYHNGNYSSALACLAQIPANVGPFHTQLKLGLLGITNSALGNYTDSAYYLRQMIALIRTFPNIFHILQTLTGIAALYGHQGYYYRAVELIAVHLDHPQTGGFGLHRAENLLNEFRPMLAKDEFQQIMDKANQGRLDISFLTSSFEVNAQVISQLSTLLDEAAFAGRPGATTGPQP